MEHTTQLLEVIHPAISKTYMTREAWADDEIVAQACLPVTKDDGVCARVVAEASDDVIAALYKLHTEDASIDYKRRMTINELVSYLRHHNKDFSNVGITLYE